MTGRKISHYEMGQRLGRGGMGEVYSARDLLLNRTVAIKVMHAADLQNETSRRRFLQEAQAASALNHPGIVTIYDVISDGEEDCIVMELVEGITLAERLARGPLELSDALALLAEICQAVGAAHDRGILHRDLKPSNLMLTTSGRVKVLDFGVAKMTAPGAGDASDLTMARTEPGRIVGTFDYMSPEQVLGRPVDHRSDIFALGTILFEMLTGQRPFNAESFAGRIHALAYDPPPRRLIGTIPPPVAMLVSRMLEKDPAQRFQSCNEVALSIATLSDGGTLPQFRQPVVARRWRELATTPLLLLAAAVLLGGGALLFHWQSVRQAAVAQLHDAPRQLPTNPIEALDRGNELLQRYWDAAAIDAAIEQFQQAARLSPEHAGVHASMAQAYWRRYRESEDAAWLQLAGRTARHAAELESQLTSARVILGLVLLEEGSLDDAQVELDAVLRLDPANADALRGQGDLAMQRGESEQAAEWYRQALAARPGDAELHTLLGATHYRLGRYAEAIDGFQKGIELAPDLMRGYSNLAAAQHMKGDYSAAARTLQRSLALRPDPYVYSNLGTLYFFQGLYPQAVDAFEKSVELTPGDYRIWANLGDAYRWTAGHEKEAADSFTRALQLLDQKLKDHPDDRSLQSRRVLYLARKGDAAAALAAGTQLEMRGGTDGSDLYRLALAYELAGGRERALDALREALELGYSREELRVDPELASLRSDVRYHKMMLAFEKGPHSESVKQKGD
jgi:eukaryotic-like serine/threonine-protein kinase